jgi:ABC-type Fe3+/spermidine/putrescine transport system ATPase subunit
MSSIRLEGLSKRFSAHGPAAVEDLTLDVAQGSIVALLGPSGCGKTTTLKLIAGLLAPEKGDIRFDGRSVLALPAEKRGAVMVFQEHALFPFMSAGANVAFGLKLRGLAPKDIRRRVNDMLELVRLPGMASRMPRELSGGQRQRVALARALVIEPKLLLLDEPLANLDAHLRDEMRSLILSAQRQTGVTTLVVTHDQEEAVTLAHRIALMFEGRLWQHGSPQELFHRPRTERAARFFGGRNFIPATRRGAVAESALGDFALDPALAELMPEGPGILTIRPEHVVVGPGGGAAHPHDGAVPLATGSALLAAGPKPARNRLAATLSSCIFMGGHTRCLLDAGGHRLEAQKSAGEADLAEGRSIELYMPPERLWMMPRNDSEAHLVPKL